MNRDILFRTAHYDYEGNFHSFSNWGFVEHGFASPRSISSCDPTKAIHEEFTGLTDKNGTKIFEGDILTNNSQNDIIVGFYNGCFINNNTYITLHTEIKDPISRQISFEITSNIHDNPTT